MYLRNYKDEYKNYQGRPEQLKKRAKRNEARDVMERLGKVSKGDGLDVNHANGNPLDNSKSNLKAVPKSENRSFPRTKAARKKNKPQ